MKTRVLFSLMVLLAANAFAQDGTPLSAKGIGEFTTFGSGWSTGMGNSGTALVRNGFLDGLNPATWSGLSNVQFTGIYNFAGVTSKDNGIGQSYYSANGNFGGGIFGLSLDWDLGFTVAAGFTPLTSYNFTINSSADSTAELPSYVYNSSGSGGLG